MLFAPRTAKLGLACCLSLGVFGTAQASSVVTDWNAQALQAIRITHPGPPQVARMLAVTNTAIYDAWAAYDVSSPENCGDRLLSATMQTVARR
jgi:hypothetical protein